MLGIKNSFDHTRCMKFARVVEVNGEKQICFRDKVISMHISGREKWFFFKYIYKKSYKFANILFILGSRKSVWDVSYSGRIAQKSISTQCGEHHRNNVG